MTSSLFYSEYLILDTITGDGRRWERLPATSRRNRGRRRERDEFLLPELDALPGEGTVVAGGVSCSCSPLCQSSPSSIVTMFYWLEKVSLFRYKVTLLLIYTFRTIVAGTTDSEGEIVPCSQEVRYACHVYWPVGTTY